MSDYEKLTPHLRAANSWIQRELAEPPRDNSMPTGSLVAVATLLDAAPDLLAVVAAAKDLLEYGDICGCETCQCHADALRSALAKVKMEGS
jgi:hypothetical protein